ncbi:FG-GAP-like repeat-containing protein [Tautonia marina]|uniref:FG-GAP-like repeat-containing protein n=1 Tax=Tautonia marina TaxID=2653855 RepID=UPI001260CBF9|nr:FG-GAP-like repeat-containing protein [Tautonia marina]
MMTPPARRTRALRKRTGGARLGFEGLEERVVLSAMVPADIDGDGRSDFAVYDFSARQGFGTFTVEQSSGGRVQKAFGGAADRPVVGDYDGDGRSDLGVFGFSPVDGFSRFAILPSRGGSAFLQGFGGAADQPVAGDFDGDGITDVAVYGFSPDDQAHRFAVLLSDGPSVQHPNGVIMLPIGEAADVPVVGDFDGDGRDDLGVYGPSGTDGFSRFRVVLSGGPSAEHPTGLIVRPFGGLDDLPAIGDYTGDGRADLAVAGFSPVEGFRRFAILPSEGTSGRSVPFGGFDDRPVPLDTEGDGITDIAVYGFSRFAVLPSSGSGAFAVPMGAAQSIPMPSPAIASVPIGSPGPGPGRPTFQIDWVNRGTATDQFSAAERRVIDRAIEIWEGVILDINRPDNTMRIRFQGGAFSGLDMGDTLGLATVRYDASGPFEATIQLDADGGGRGWYVDPTPADDLEFAGAASPTFLVHGPADQFDLLSTVVHEIGHALGFGIDFANRLGSGLSPWPGGGLIYQGPTGARAVFNDAVDHLDPIEHAYDLLTADAFVGTRAYPTALNLQLLVDAYGYRVFVPPLPLDVRPPRILDARIASLGVGNLIVSVDFDEGIDLTGARDPSRYALLRPQGADFVPVASPFTSATFDVSRLRLRLRLRSGVMPAPGWLLVVPGLGPNAITDLAGNALDGNQDGLSGPDAVVTLRF